MKFGASVWPFKWEAPYEDTIVRIAKLGFQAVELIAWDREALDEYYTPGKIKELKDIIISEGLELSQFVSSPSMMASPVESKRKEALEHFKKLVEVGKELGTKIVNSVAPYPFSMDFPRITERPLVQEQTVDIPGNLDWSKNWEDYIEVLKECASICEDAEIQYSLEPHPYRYVSNADSMLRILSRVNSSAIGINFDPSHLFPCGEIPQVVIYRLGKNIIHAHLSDNDGLTNVHWRPGKGKMDWNGILKAFKDVGYDGVLSLELEDVPGVSRSNRFGEAEKTSTEILDAEYIKAKKYLKDICQHLNIPVE